MPIKLTVKNRNDDSIVVYRYFGLVLREEVAAALKEAFGKLTPRLPYRSLMIFEDDVDLSELSPDVLESLRAFGDKNYRENNLGPRSGAAVLNGSSDAQLILPFFNALNLARRGIDFSYELCPDVASALAHLGIAQTEGEEIIAQTM
jgi:hypothetical protein